ncbi:MAG: cytochrome c [Rhodospirillales bacterium]
MPYNSYTLMSSQDALAIKGYLFSLKPVHAPATPDRLRFPFNQRWGMAFWNILNNPRHRFEADSTKSADWNRGAYLVQALGHCDQCHTPRNWMQGLKNGSAYSGARRSAGWPTTSPAIRCTASAAGRTRTWSIISPPARPRATAPPPARWRKSLPTARGS